MRLANNNIFKNLDKKIYVASKNGVKTDDYNNEIVTYDKPFCLGKFNYQPLSGSDLEAYISAYGETKNKLARVFLDTKYKDKIKEFDVVYLYGQTPNEEKINGVNANYYVRTFAEQNTVIMVVFEEIIKEEN